MATRLDLEKLLQAADNGRMVAVVATSTFPVTLPKAERGGMRPVALGIGFAG